jgi:hypothetical protein
MCVSVSSSASGAVALRASTSPPDDFATAGALLGQGQEKYETADYVGAIELWSEAYAALPDTPEASQYRSVLVYQIAAACREAYALDQETKYLRKAERLLEQYVESLNADDDESRETAKEALDEVRLRIKEDEAAAAARRSVVTEAASAEPRSSPADEREPPGKGLLIAGGVTMGVGAVLLAVMGAGLAQGGRYDSEGEALIEDGVDPSDPQVGDLLDKGQQANTTALATGITGGLLLATGVGLIVADVILRKKYKSDVALAPAFGRGFAGVSLFTRF